MRGSRWIVVSVFLTWAALRGLQAQEATPPKAKATGDFLVFAGQKVLSQSDLTATTTPLFEFGILGLIRPSGLPVRLGLNVLYSSGTVSPPTSLGVWARPSIRILEIGFGPCKVWSAGRTRPYVGGGVAVLSATADFSSGGGEIGSSNGSSSGTTLAPWIDGGVFWRLAENFNLGIGVRWSHATIDLHDLYSSQVQVSAGGFHYGIVFGFGS